MERGKIEETINTMGLVSGEQLHQLQQRYRQQRDDGFPGFDGGILNIVKRVNAFQYLGLITVASCESHPDFNTDRRYPYFYLMFCCTERGREFVYYLYTELRMQLVKAGKFRQAAACSLKIQINRQEDLKSWTVDTISIWSFINNNNEKADFYTCFNRALELAETRFKV